MFTRFAGSLSVLLLVGCGNADEKTDAKAASDAPGGGATLAPRPTITRPASLASLEKSDLEAKVRELVNIHYENDKDEASQTHDLSVCIDSVEAAVENGALRIRALAQLSKCFAQWQMTEDMTQPSSRDVFDSTVVCDGLDPKKYAGTNTIETYKAMSQACSEAKTSRQTSYTKTTVDLEELVDDKTISTTLIVSESSLQGADGSFCDSPVPDLAGAGSGCRATEIETRTRVEAASGTSEVKVTYSELQAKDLSFATAADRFPSSGTVSVVVNDWTGTLTFKGPSTAPTLSASNGSQTVENAPMAD